MNYRGAPRHKRCFVVFHGIARWWDLFGAVNGSSLKAWYRIGIRVKSCGATRFLWAKYGNGIWFHRITKWIFAWNAAVLPRYSTTGNLLWRVLVFYYFETIMSWGGPNENHPLFCTCREALKDTWHCQRTRKRYSISRGKYLSSIW